MESKFKLYVRCMTYNQHHYITDTMNGFVMQQTTFPYVCCIVDDASTDGENVVINEFVKDYLDLNAPDAITNQDTHYGTVTYAPHKTNPSCYFLVILLKENHYQSGREYETTKYIQEWIGNTEYVALCEGDDYWIYPKKLQIQIDYLDKHPEVVVSCHRCNLREERDGGSKIYLRPYDEDMSRYREDGTFLFNFEEFFVKGYWIAEYHATVLRNIYDPYYWKNCKHTRDVHMMFYLLKHGLGVCHSFIGGVYRRNMGGVFSSLQQVQIADVQNKVYTEIYNQTKEPLIVNNIAHFRSVLLRGHKYNLPFDRITLKAWGQYIDYLWKEARHAIVPKWVRKIIKK